MRNVKTDLSKRVCSARFSSCSSGAARGIVEHAGAACSTTRNGLMSETGVVDPATKWDAESGDPCEHLVMPSVEDSGSFCASFANVRDDNIQRGQARAMART